MRRIGYLIGFTTALMTIAGGVSAGGWATTRIDDRPASFQAGETHDVGYTILQHGRTPADVDATALVFEHPSTGEQLRFPGSANGSPGRYLASVTLPESGEWAWAADQDWFGSHPLGTIEVTSRRASLRTERGDALWLLAAVALAVSAVASNRLRVVRQSARLARTDVA